MSILLAHAISPHLMPSFPGNVRARKVKGIAALDRIQRMVGLSDSELLECCLSLTQQHDDATVKNGTLTGAYKMADKL